MDFLKSIFKKEKPKPKLNSFKEDKNTFDEFPIKIELDPDNFIKNAEKYINEFDKNQNGILDFFEEDSSDPFIKLLEKSEKKVISIEKSNASKYLLDFQRLSNYLIDLNKNINLEYRLWVFNRYNEFKNLISEFNKIEVESKDKNFNYVIIVNDTNERDRAIEIGNQLKKISMDIKLLNHFNNKINESLKHYSELMINSVYMLSCLIEKKLLKFYELYLKFEKIGIFTEEWQNKIFSSIDNATNVLKLQTIEIANQTSEIRNQTSEIRNQTKQIYDLKKLSISQINVSNEISSEIKTLNNSVQNLDIKQSNRLDELIIQNRSISENLFRIEDINKDGFKIMNSNLKKVKGSLQFQNIYNFLSDLVLLSAINKGNNKQQKNPFE